MECIISYSDWDRMIISHSIIVPLSLAFGRHWKTSIAYIFTFGRDVAADAIVMDTCPTVCFSHLPRMQQQQQHVCVCLSLYLSLACTGCFYSRSDGEFLPRVCLKYSCDCPGGRDCIMLSVVDASPVRARGGRAPAVPPCSRS